jgi:hypothetical protein
MTELHLLIDDLRSVGEDMVARTPEDGKAMLSEFPVTHLYIDHDLGLDPEGNEYENGYKVVCWAIENDCLPQYVQIVSSNPVGRQNIEAALQNAGYIRERGYWTMYWLGGRGPRRGR